MGTLLSSASNGAFLANPRGFSAVCASQRSPQRRVVRGTKQPCLTYLEPFGEDESLDIRQDDDTSGFEKEDYCAVRWCKNDERVHRSQVLLR